MQLFETQVNIVIKEEKEESDRPPFFIGSEPAVNVPCPQANYIHYTAMGADCQQKIVTKNKNPRRHKRGNKCHDQLFFVEIVIKGSFYAAQSKANLI